MRLLLLLKRSLGLYPTFCGIHCHCSTSKCSNAENAAAGKGYDHVSISLEFPKGGRSEIYRDQEGQSRRYDMTSLQTVPCYIAGMLALSCLNRKSDKFAGQVGEGLHLHSVGL